MTHRQQIKLERLRNDIQEGLGSGDSAPSTWKQSKLKRESEGGSRRVSGESNVNAPSSQEAARAP
ncbi:MAG: hypothetical protein AABO57_18530 [Acidobacteriota bacterium]